MEKECEKERENTRGRKKANSQKDKQRGQWASVCLCLCLCLWSVGGRFKYKCVCPEDPGAGVRAETAEMVGCDRTELTLSHRDALCL